MRWIVLRDRQGLSELAVLEQRERYFKPIAAQAAIYDIAANHMGAMGTKKRSQKEKQHENISI